MAAQPDSWEEIVKQYEGQAKQPATPAAPRSAPPQPSSWEETVKQYEAQAKQPAAPAAVVPPARQDLGQLRSRTGQLYTPTPYGSMPVLDAPQHIAEGVEQIAEAFREAHTKNQAETTGPRLKGATADPRKITAGAQETVGGVLEAATPLIGAGLAAAPLDTVITLAAGLLADKAAQKGLEAAGVDPVYAQAGGTVAGLGVGGVVGSRAFKGKLAEAAWARRQAREQAAGTQPSARGKTPTVEVLPPEAAPGARRQPAPEAADSIPLGEEPPPPANWEESVQRVEQQYAQQQQAPAAPALPRHLAGAKPRYASGEKQFELTFQNDVDRAAYITAQKTPSKRDADYLAFAMDATGLSEEEVRAHGAKVRASIKAQAKGADPGTVLNVPEVATYWREQPAREVLPPEAAPGARRQPAAPMVSAELPEVPSTQVSAPTAADPAAIAAPSRELAPVVHTPEDRGPGWVGNIPTSEIQVDAPRFQFKRDVGEGGAGEELRSVKKWDPEKAGVVAVWRDPGNGKTYVVNGHHRLELAQRTGAPEVTVRYLDASDALRARTKGALINIAEGRGESTDAAKVFRDSGMTPAELEADGVSLKGKIAKEGFALSRLAKPIFEDVISGELSPARGAVLSGLESHPDQQAVYDLIRKREREKGHRLTNDQVEEMIRLNNRTSTVTESSADDAQGGLFGVEEMTRSLLPEVADVSDYVRKQLKSEKKLFGAVASDAAAERLAEKGNVIKAGENAQVAQRANQGIELYDKLSERSGPIDGILNRAARSLSDGEPPHDVKQRAYKAIREELTRNVDQLSGVPKVSSRGAEGLGTEGPLQARAGEHDRGSAGKEVIALDPYKPKPPKNAPSLFDEPAEEGRGFSGALFRGTEGKTRGGELRESPVGELGRGTYATPHRWLAATYGGGPTADVKHGTREVHHLELAKPLQPREVAYLDGGKSGDADAVLTNGKGEELWRGRITGKKSDRPLIDAMNQAARNAGAKAIIGGSDSLALNQTVVLDTSILKKPRKLSIEEALKRDDKPHALAGAEQISLVSKEEEGASRKIAEKTAAQLEGERLTAQMKSGMPAKSAKLKPAQTRSLFDDEGPEQNSFFDSYRPPEKLPRLPEAVRTVKYERGKPTAEHAQLTAWLPLPIEGRAGRFAEGVLINQSGMELIGRAAGAPYDYIGSGNVGLHLSPRDVGPLARNLRASMRAHFPDGPLPEAVRDLDKFLSAAERTGKSVVFVADAPQWEVHQKTALTEEIGHAMQASITGRTKGHLGASLDRFARSPLYQKAAAEIEDRYGEMSPDAIATEIGVRLMRADGHEELALSVPEARKLGAEYVRALRKAHGSAKAKIVADEVLDAFQTQRSRTQDVDRRSRSLRPERRNGPPDGSGSDLPPGYKPPSGQSPRNDSLSNRQPSNPRPDSSEGPDFLKRRSAAQSFADVLKPVKTRIAQEGPAGAQIARKLTRAQDIGEVSAGKRVVTLRDAGVHELEKPDRENLLDALQGTAAPKNPAVRKAFAGARAVLNEIASEAKHSGVMAKVKRTLRPGDPLPPGVVLTKRQDEKIAAGERIPIVYRRPFQQRADYFPHVIPSSEGLRSGDIRRDVLDNVVRQGVFPDRDTATEALDEYRKFLDGSGRAKLTEKYLVDSGQARDVDEARLMMNQFREHALTRRAGSLEFARQADLPFYDPDPARVLPQLVTAHSIRLAQVREFGQGNQQLSKLIREIETTGGNAEFVREQIKRAVGFANEPDTAMARVSAAVRMLQGFKLGLASIPNATQGALNSFLHSDLASTIAGGKGLLTKEGRRFAMQSGASLEGVVNEMLQNVSTENRALSTYLRATGFTQTEQANRIWAANAGHAYAKRMLARLQKDSTNGRARKALADMGLNPDVLLKIGKVEGNSALIAAKKFSDVTQFRSGPLDLPAFASTPAGKVFFQFKSFTYNQTRLVYDELVGEAKAGRWGRGLRTLLAIATVYTIAGEAIADLRSLLPGKPERKDDGPLKRYLEDVAQAGALGFAYDVLESGAFGRAVDFFAGPTLSTIGEGINAIMRPAATTETRLRRIAKFASQQTTPTALLYRWLVPDKQTGGGMSAESERLMRGRR
jgi:hypothetical protein